MILALLIITTGLCWLLYETNWMRVRLPVGEIDKVKRVSYDEIKNKYLNRLSPKQTPKWYSDPEVYPPICGQEWLENTMHVIPETKIELVNHAHKYTIKSNNAECLRDAFRVYRNPYLRVKVDKILSNS